MAEEVQNIVITRDDSNQSQEQDEAGKYLEAAIEGIRNLTVDEDDIKNRESNCDGDGREFEKVKNFEYPLRPHAQDCVSYLRTGGCKHGSFCKYNHPFGRVFQDDQNHKAGTSEQTSLIECKFYRTPEGCKYGKTCWYSHPKETFESESPEKDTFLEQKGQTECKYHLTSRGCKYGSACRYSHSKQNPSIFMEKSELPPPELNFLGLPIRELEKECPFYMRTGACGYGVKCIYNHPDPSAAGGPKPPSLNGNLLRNLNQVSAPFSSLGTSEATITSVSSDKSMQDGTFPWLDSHSYFAHDMHHHSGSAMEQRKIGVSFSASTMMDGTNATHTYRPYQMNIHEEFPARPGEPECSHFMKTGSCKFKSACRFHHPKIRAPALPSGFSLSSKGLPLRPGRKICWHYGRTGECGHGVLCLFDHPENFASSTSFPF